MPMKNEIILYSPNELAEHIEVWIEDETVWLSQAQMAVLFSQTKQNISLHINNCFKENELEKGATVKDSLTVARRSNSLSANMFRKCKLMFCLVVRNKSAIFCWVSQTVSFSSRTSIFALPSSD